jgi:hypothetical protein
MELSQNVRVPKRRKLSTPAAVAGKTETRGKPMSAKKDNKIFIRSIIFSAAIILWGLGATAVAAPVIKIGHVAPPFHGQHIGLEHFATYVSEHTAGKFTFKVFPLGQLGGERSMAEQVQTGTLPMAAITTAVLSNFVPEIGVVDLPFLFPDRRTAYATPCSTARCGTSCSPASRKRAWSPCRGWKTSSAT